jgi:hypothetical protein
MNVLTFSEFPNAKPYYAESALRGLRATAKAYLSRPGGMSKARDLNKKINHSRDYYDLVALKSRSISPTLQNLNKLRNGYIHQNTDLYKNKPEGLKNGMFDDPDSRWFQLSRSEARDIILDEIFTAHTEGSAEIPTPSNVAPAETADSLPGIALTIGTVAASVGLGYALHRSTLRDTNQR